MRPFIILICLLGVVGFLPIHGNAQEQANSIVNIAALVGSNEGDRLAELESLHQRLSPIHNKSRDRVPINYALIEEALSTLGEIKQHTPALVKLAIKRDLHPFYREALFLLFTTWWSAAPAKVFEIQQLNEQIKEFGDNWEKQASILRQPLVSAIEKGIATQLVDEMPDPTQSFDPERSLAASEVQHVIFLVLGVLALETKHRETSQHAVREIACLLACEDFETTKRLAYLKLPPRGRGYERIAIALPAIGLLDLLVVPLSMFADEVLESPNRSEELLVGRGRRIYMDKLAEALRIMWKTTRVWGENFTGYQNPLQSVVHERNTHLVWFFQFWFLANTASDDLMRWIDNGSDRKPLSESDFSQQTEEMQARRQSARLVLNNFHVQVRSALTTAFNEGRPHALLTAIDYATKYLVHDPDKNQSIKTLEALFALDRQVRTSITRLDELAWPSTTISDTIEAVRAVPISASLPMTSASDAVMTSTSGPLNRKAVHRVASLWVEALNESGVASSKRIPDAMRHIVLFDPEYRRWYVSNANLRGQSWRAAVRASVAAMRPRLRKLRTMLGSPIDLAPDLDRGRPTASDVYHWLTRFEAIQAIEIERPISGETFEKEDYDKRIKAKEDASLFAMAQLVRMLASNELAYLREIVLVTIDEWDERELWRETLYLIHSYRSAFYTNAVRYFVADQLSSKSGDPADKVELAARMSPVEGLNDLMRTIRQDPYARRLITAPLAELPTTWVPKTRTRPTVRRGG